MALSDHFRFHRPVPLADLRKQRTPVRNINQEHDESLRPLERLAIFITDRVGTMGFFLLIFGWTIIWCGYNIIASKMPSVGLKPFDPFPAFVSYLLISNVIQILLMPLIMVGQNLQGRHSEKRAENDFEVNIKAEKEIETILQHLENQGALLLKLAQAQAIDLTALKETVAADADVAAPDPKPSA